MTVTSFKGGIHPPEKKELSAHKPITGASPPARLVIPLIQHIGAPCKPVVKVRESVKKGDVIGAPTGFVSAPVHSSVSGTVVAIGEFPTATGKLVPSVTVENDFKEEWAILSDNPDYMSLSPDEMREKIRAAGIVGLGGAAFPSIVKLSPPKEKPIDTVIINGAECEPYLTADYRLMLERAVDVISGLRIIMKVLGVERGFVGIEDNKPRAIHAIAKAVEGLPSIRVCTLPTKYPQGAEKMLIKTITGREVPPRALPMDVRVVVHNVGTACAIFEAVRFGKPLIERVVTVTGEGVREPKNLLAKVGTLISQLIADCGGLREDTAKVIAGGPMMGFALPSLDVPVTKGTSGIVAMTAGSIAHAESFEPCIRCGRCIDRCPMGLMPSMLSIYAEKGFYEGAKDYGLFDCFECGCCTFACPSKRPIVQLIRLAKSQVKP